MSFIKNVADLAADAAAAQGLTVKEMEEVAGVEYEERVAAVSGVMSLTAGVAGQSWADIRYQWMDAGGTIGFNPLSLSPALWLDASDTSTITESSGSVSQWDDKSGNGYNFTQAVGASQPTTGVTTQNGLNVLDFDGTDFLAKTSVDVLDFFDAANNQVMLFAVGSRTSGLNWQPMNALGATTRVSFDVRSSAFWDAANVPTARLSPGSGVGVWPLSETAVWSVFRNGANMGVNLNGASIGTKTNASGTVTTETATLQVGRAGASQTTVGTICEVIVVAGYSADVFSAVTTYLNTKWDLF